MIDVSGRRRETLAIAAAQKPGNCHTAMAALHAVLSAHPDTALSIGGLVLGILFGALLSTTNYCTMGAISDWKSSGSTGRLGAVALAAAVTIGGAQALDAAGVITLSKSLYLVARINWAGAIVGGLIFGAGMVYAGGCPARNLVRAGSGDLRAAISLVVVAIAAYATISGVLGPLRAQIDTATAIDLKHYGAATQSIHDVLSIPRLAAMAMIAMPLVAFAWGRARIFAEPRNLFGGLGVGALATAGWMLTGLTSDEFAANPVQPTSFSFVRPVADAIDWIERSTALGWPGFGAASVFGVVIGAAAASALAGEHRITSFSSTGDLTRHLLGAVAMGAGGVLALGCSIGQGVTGISTLSVQSVLACCAIFAGAVLALTRIERSL